MTSTLSALDSGELRRIAEILKCIAHPARLRVVEVLNEKERLNVTELRKYTGLEQSLLSHHLIKMKDKGVLVSERQGKNIFYALTDTNITKIFDCMSNCQLI